MSDSGNIQQRIDFFRVQPDCLACAAEIGDEFFCQRQRRHGERNSSDGQQANVDGVCRHAAPLVGPCQSRGNQARHAHHDLWKLGEQHFKLRTSEFHQHRIAHGDYCGSAPATSEKCYFTDGFAAPHFGQKAALRAVAGVGAQASADDAIDIVIGIPLMHDHRTTGDFQPFHQR